MALIFLASTELFSFESTGQFLRPFLRWLLPDASDATLTLIQVAIRKTAHMTEYGILAAFVFSAWRRSSAKAPWSWDRRHALGTWSLCVAYAALDELHQASVPSRTGSVTDVGWDALGAALLIGVLWLARRRSGAAPVTKGLPETA